MPITNVSINDDIIRGLAPTEYKPDKAPITIACELHSGLNGSPARGSISMRLLASTTPEVARVIGSTVQSRVKGLIHLQAEWDE